jgi:putative ABC transport system substrate-binding protein
VFGVPDDPVKFGLVASLARPGGNATGVNFFTAELVAKRLGLLRELVPKAVRVAVLINPANATNAEATLRDARAAAHAMALQLQIVNAGSADEIDAAFASFAGERPDALLVAPDAFFNSRRFQLAALAARHALPTAYSVRDYAQAGGLMSYGTSIVVPPGRGLHGACPQGREAGGPPRGAGDPLRVRHQSRDRAVARPRRPARARRQRRRGDRMIGRRQLVSLLGGAAAWPLAIHAQDQVRRIGWISAIDDDDPLTRRRLAALNRGLQQLGWIDGRNLRVELRSGSGEESIRRNIAELIALAPDVLLSSGTASLAHLLQATRTIPIVFANVADPVGAGFIDSLAQPGGNATGFLQSEYSLNGKLAELLKLIAPTITRAAVLRDPTISAAIGQFAVIQSVAPSLGLDIRAINVRQADEIERGITAFARSGHGGLIVPSGATANVNRSRIIALAAQHRLPAVYSNRTFAGDGGLISYGADNLVQFEQMATYIDRILRGAKPADLPMQAPTRYELVINVKTAKALGLEVPATLLARADEVIE